MRFHTSDGRSIHTFSDMKNSALTALAYASRCALSRSKHTRTDGRGSLYIRVWEMSLQQICNIYIRPLFQMPRRVCLCGEGCNISRSVLVVNLGTSIE
jgi:hypothetical protein